MQVEEEDDGDEGDIYDCVPEDFKEGNEGMEDVGEEEEDIYDIPPGKSALSEPWKAAMLLPLLYSLLSFDMPGRFGLLCIFPL